MSILEVKNVKKTYSTRFGGVSEGALASLNLGTHRGDRPENVLENYARLGRAVGFAPEETVFTKQVHSALVERVGRADCGRGLQREAEHGVDGLVTDEPGVALTIFSADCTPVLLFDPVARAIGAAHAGWRGTAAGIAARGRGHAAGVRLPTGEHPRGHRSLHRPVLL